MSETPLLGLPLLQASQAQKHVTHNEALILLDAAIQLSVISRGAAIPPPSPAEGDRFLAAAGSSGGWAGHDGDLAIFEAASWRFSAPRIGWRLWVEDEGRFLVFDGLGWRDLQDIDQLDNMSLLGVNTTADAGNRFAVASAGVLFTHEGGDHRLKVNKEAHVDTASLLYQTDYSGRAELGLAGDDDFRVKVSPDGVNWHDAIHVDRATGTVTLPNTASQAAGMYLDLAAAAASAIPPVIERVYCHFYASTSGQGGAWYKRTVTEPTHGLKFQDAGSGWWEIDEQVVYLDMA
ncbi:MAG: DUF2793 domain-containing protein, partial [Rhizobiaceae bacterium]|nr:DUF2793 domain-containing protein [Rhizobiaceae bacterium]